MSNQTAASLRSQGKDITLTNAKNSLFYDDSCNLYLRDDAPAKPIGNDRKPTVLWGSVVSLHIETPNVMKGIKKVDSRTAQQEGYTQIHEIYLTKPNVLCCGYRDGVFFAELYRLHPGVRSYIWYISREGFQFDRKNNVMTGGKHRMIVQSKPAEGLMAVQVRRPLRYRYGTSIYEASLSTGHGPWVPLKFTV